MHATLHTVNITIVTVLLYCLGYYYLKLSLHLEKFLVNKDCDITPLLWTEELHAIRNATHYVGTRLKNVSSNNIIFSRLL